MKISSPSFFLAAAFTLGGAFAMPLTEAAATSSPKPLESRSFFQADYPRLVLFRGVEALATDEASVAEIDARILGHDAIVAKAFDEEKVGLAHYALPRFRAIRERHPDMLFILHFDGKARDPRDEPSLSYPGYWLHRLGCRVLSDLPAAGETAEITVEDPSLFSMSVGKKARYPDTMTICALNADGTPNWLVTESVDLVAIDAASRKLTIKRGILNSEPRIWQGGAAYIAAMAVDGQYPMFNDSKPLNMWRFNYSVKGPADAQGRRLPERLADDLIARLQPGGPADFFDGVTFDVMPYHLTEVPGGDAEAPRNAAFIERFGYAEEDVDTDGDGKRDRPSPDGIDPFATGVAEMLRHLREGLGPDRVIMIDANRCVDALLNGVEAEGWPTYEDGNTLDLWSSGVNDQFFWAARSTAPGVRYFQRYGPDKVRIPRSRMIMAAAQLLGSALVTQANPKPVAGENWGAFDELKMGVEQRLHWLGQPREEARRLALASADIFRGEGGLFPPTFQRRWSSSDGTISFARSSPPELQLESKRPGQHRFEARLSGVPLSGPDLVLAFDVKAAPLPGMPVEIARKITVRLTMTDGTTEVGTGQWSWADDDWFRPVFYFRGLEEDVVDITIECADSGPVYIRNVRGFSKPDVMTREFDGGLVLANPSLAPVVFDLEKLYPNRKFRRIRGSAKQDPKTNNGEPVGREVTVPANDGLFLVRER